MNLNDWLKLKSGTDIRGTAIGGVEGENVDLTDDAIFGIIRAFCYRLCQITEKTNPTIAVGHDSRLSAQRICDCIVRAATQSGCNVILTGLSSTPSMFMLLQEQDIRADASIMITASHLPYNKNGLKFFLPTGGLEGDDIKEILTLASEGKSCDGIGTMRAINYLDRYSDSLVRFIREKTGEQTPLKGKKIIVDAGNGAGGFYAKNVLRPLGADTEGSQFLDPDGRFPNHIPNPENKTAMHSISQQVKNVHADLGIIFDTDVDRAGAVDSNGEEINRNRLIALISAILLEEKPGTIVTDSVTSDGLAQFIAAHGGKHCRFKRGYKNVINKSKELNENGEYSPLAIETSGHAALKENYFLDDGAYLVTRILISVAKLAKEGKSVSDLIADLPEPKQAAEARLKFTEKAGDNFKEIGLQIIADIQQKAEKLYQLAPDNFEGVRINFNSAQGNGWTLVRMSLHEPIMPINFESDSEGGCRIIAQNLLNLLSSYNDVLDLSALENFIQNA